MRKRLRRGNVEGGRTRRRLWTSRAVALAVSVALAGGGLSFGLATRAAAAAGWGPGLGTKTPYAYWGGAYLLPGNLYGWCVSPGAAAPTNPAIVTDPYTPGTYAGPNPAGLAVLSYDAQANAHALTGWTNGGTHFSATDFDAAIQEIASETNGIAITTIPTSSRATTFLVNTLRNQMSYYAGPWTMTDSPPAGPYLLTTNYTGTITVTSAAGHPVVGVPVAISQSGLSNFVWDTTNGAGVTNAAGQVQYTFNRSTSSGPGSFSLAFSADGVGSTAPIDIPPTGSGGQNMLLAAPSRTPMTQNYAASITSAPSVTPDFQIQIKKVGNDESYLPVTGAQFQIINSAGSDTSYGTGAVIQTLTVGATGETPKSATLPPGTYTVHESQPPAGYSAAPDQTVTETATQITHTGATVTLTFSDTAVPGTLTIGKEDSTTHAPLGGAQFSVYYDPSNNGTYTQQIKGPDGGNFLTSTNGKVVGTLSKLMPGNYQVTEVVPPPGHVLPTPPSEVVTVKPGAKTTLTFADKTQPSITTKATPTSAVTGTIHDTAAFTGSANAGGSITFRAYGPFGSAGSASCVNSSLAFTSTAVPVKGPGTYSGSSFVPKTPGLYEWVASYTPGTTANNVPVAGGCGAAGEASQVVQVATTAAPGGALGGAIHDQAAVAGPTGLAGTLVFRAYGPFTSATGASCTTSTLAFTSKSVAVKGPGTYPEADSFTPTTAGLYEWVETFTGSGTQKGFVSTGHCGDSSETSSLVSVSTSATPTAQADSAIADSATVVGASNTTGTLSFSLYGPFAKAATASCTAKTRAYTSSTPVTVTGPGVYPMAGAATVTAPGLYEWVETFTGTGAYKGTTVTGHCGDSAETSTVAPLVQSPPPPTG